MLRFIKLGWSPRRWWETRHCRHPRTAHREQMINAGMRKMTWCTRCQRTWFV